MNKVYKQFYVSPEGSDSNPGSQVEPFKSLNGAIDAIRKCNKDMDGDIIVNIWPGYYQIDETVVFDETVSGQNGYNVVIKGIDKNYKPVFSGGKKITGWKKCEDGKIWWAPADVEDMRTLYINELPAQRATSKYLYNPIELYKEEGSENIADGVMVSAENFKCDYEHPEELEVVWPLYWTLQRIPLVKMFKKDDKVVLILKQPVFDFGLTKDAVFTSPGPSTEKGAAHKRFYLENAKEFVDEPGKFYFSKTEKKVYYYPFEEENLNFANVYTAQTEGLIKIAGSSIDNKIHNIIFDNMEFCYGGWNDVTYEGLINTQADVIVNEMHGAVERGGKYIPAQIDVFNADNVHIRNLKIHSLGSTAICMSDAVRNSTVTGNRITDVSGTGIMLDHWDHRQEMPENMERCENLLVANNVIHRAATEFRGHIGITIFFPRNCVVCHNDIKNTPYSGVSFGWGWGGQRVFDAHSNRVEYNRIEDVTDTTHDGAHIYTLDTMRNGFVQGNYLIKSGEYRGGVYLDSGSAELTIRNNVIQDSEQWLFARAYVRLAKVSAYDNHFEEGSYGDIDGVNVTRYNNYEAPRDKDGKTMWPDAAKEIMAFAGLEDGYKHLLEGTDLPAWRKDVVDYQPKLEFASEKNTWTQSVDFIKGAGEGSAYHTNSGKMPQTYGDHYGHLMNEMSAGDWLKYDVYIKEDGEYDLQFKATEREEKTTVSAKVCVEIDGKPVIAPYELPRNGFWIDEWRRPRKAYPIINLGKVKLSKGSHTIKFEFIDNTPSFEAFRFYNESLMAGVVYDEGVIK